jgi:hypothetical protein
MKWLQHFWRRWFAVPTNRRRTRLALETLETRWTPALSMMGPYTAADWNLAQELKVDTYQILTAIPASTTGAKSYLDVKNAVAFHVDEAVMGAQFAAAPREFTAAASDPSVLTLPKPDGTFARFHIWSNPMMEPGLAAQFPDFRVVFGQGIDDPTATLAASVTSAGFFAQVLSPNGAYYIDPYYHLESGTYVSYFRNDLKNNHGGGCHCALCVGAAEVAESTQIKELPQSPPPTTGNTALRPTNGANLREFRTAVAATAEYTAFHGGTQTSGQAAIVTAMTRVNGVYRTELSIQMTLVANNQNLVFTNAATDGYSNTDTFAMLDENQTKVDAVIGNANYDIGHVFATGDGGVASLGSVGSNPFKAQGVTGRASPVGDPFVIDYVAHEMGHQFGAQHTFNGTQGAAAGNVNTATAVEPGSGSTIMAYAGICGSDNLQSNSDPYFHYVSLDQITEFLDDIPGVGTTTTTSNAIPAVNAGTDFTIPARTPFALSGSATDANTAANLLSYGWEQIDTGSVQGINAPSQSGWTDNGASPIFRSFTPTVNNPSRTFPRLSNLLAGTTSVGELLPTTTRALDFRLVVRDNQNPGAYGSDAMRVNVVDTGTAFAVTSPNTAVSLTGGSLQTVTWNVAGTTANGINAANVNILLSTDGGNTFPTTLASGVANDGSESVVIPNTPSTTARIRVQPVGNVFFDISDKNFTITAGSAMQVSSTTPAVGGTLSGPTATLTFTFTQPVNAATVGTGDITVSSGTVTNATSSGSTATYTISGLNSETALTVNMAASAVASTTGNNVGAFNGNYTVDLTTATFPTLTAAVPQGSLLYTNTTSASINTTADTDSFTLDLAAGQRIGAVVTPVAGLQPVVTLTGPGGTNVSASGASAGKAANLASTAITTAGTYTFTVSSSASTTGNYSLLVLLNGLGETDTANDTTATAQSLTGTFVSLGGSASVASVRGTFDSPSGLLPAEVEANNTTGTANDAKANFQAVTNNLFHMGLTGTISSATDTDFFNIGALQVGDVVTITSSGADSSRGTLGDPFVSLFRSGSGTAIASDDDGGPGPGNSDDSIIYRFTVTTADTYFVNAASAASATGTYQLGVYLENTGTAPTTGGTLTSETEANNTTATANNASTSWRAVQFQATTTGTISAAADVDTFSYTLAVGDVLTVVADSTSTLDARVRLLNSAGTTIADEDGTSNGPGADSPIYAYRITTAGTYFVQVRPATGTGTYTLLTQLSAATAPPSGAPGPDHYSFTLTAGQTVALNLEGLAAGTFALDLLDSAGAVAAPSTTTATNVDRQVASFTATTAGTYYARVSGTTGVNYNLVVTTGAVLDSEPNDTFAAPQTLGAGVRALGAVTASNDDWYSITVAAGETIQLQTATLGGTSSQFVNLLDPRLELYSPANSLLASDDNSAGGVNAQISFVASTAGTYRVRVANTGSTAGEYVLTQSVTSNPPPTVTSIVVNDGSAQRSRVTTLRVNFSEVVSFVGAPTAAFTLTGPSGAITFTAVLDGSGLFATITPTSGVTSGSLNDGNYTLTVVAGQIQDGGGATLQAAAGNTLNFHRLFGDANGDRVVNGADFFLFRTAFGTSTGNPQFLAYFDFDNNGTINTTDRTEFYNRYGSTI